MDKKDIYEHLAKIYLGSSSVKKKKARSKDIKKYVFISIVVTAVIFVFMLQTLYKQKTSFQETALVVSNEVVKINYNFDPVKKEIHSWNLNNLNLSSYKTLKFSLKKSNYSDTVAMRVEFANNFKEKSEVYFKDISNKWQDYSVALSDFKSISDWSTMESLAYIVEEWNTKENKGIVYIDNVRLVK